MRRLVGVEMTRLTARRGIRLLVLALLIITVVAGTTVFLKSHRTTPERLARARAAVASEHARCLSGEIKPFDAPPGVELDPQQFCDEQFNADNVRIDKQFHLSSFRDVVKGTATFMVILGLAIGATFIGAEWSHGTIVTLLAWEPRRYRVVAAKMIGCAAVVFAGAVVFEIILGAALVPAAIFRGDTAGLNGMWYRDVAGTVLRGATLAVIASMIGVSIANVARNTAAAIGIAFVYIAVIENIIRGLLPGYQRWLLTLNAGRFLIAEDMTEFPYRSTLGAGLLVAAYALGIFELSTATFRRRDIT
ncbi:MAG: ABC transporter permease subunit [Actinomycetota bacterium]|nr:ABC transporter permease [Actinomycetota bacterium]